MSVWTVGPCAEPVVHGEDLHWHLEPHYLLLTTGIVSLRNSVLLLAPQGPKNTTLSGPARQRAKECACTTRT